MQNQAEFKVNILDGRRMAIYNSANDEVIIDGKELSELVKENVASAKEYCPDLKEDEVWIAKFTSLVLHEIIHRTLQILYGKEVSIRFDRLFFKEFMEKIPLGGCEIILWSDALETCPIGDTWFR